MVSVAPEFAETCISNEHSPRYYVAFRDHARKIMVKVETPDVIY